jgi:hypothetical protein
VVRCHAGKTGGFVPAERHLTFPADSASDASCGPNGSLTSKLPRLLEALVEACSVHSEIGWLYHDPLSLVEAVGVESAVEPAPNPTVATTVAISRD